MHTIHSSKIYISRHNICPHKKQLFVPGNLGNNLLLLMGRDIGLPGALLPHTYRPLRAQYLQTRSSILTSRQSTGDMGGSTFELEWKISLFNNHWLALEEVHFSSLRIVLLFVNVVTVVLSLF